MIYLSLEEIREEWKLLDEESQRIGAAQREGIEIAEKMSSTVEGKEKPGRCDRKNKVIYDRIIHLLSKKSVKEIGR